jgi:hypothetical protein
MPMANLAFLLASLTTVTPADGAVPQSAPHSTTEAWTDPTPRPRDAALMRRTMLAAHAAARESVGVPPLAWDDRLAESARLHAEQLARTGRMDHHGRFAAPRGVGENLWMGSRDGFSYAEMVMAWLDEARDYINAPAPGFSRTGAWQDVGHYSQMVWRRTTAFGCAMVSGAADDVLVCRYAPGGNVIGQPAF